MEDQDVVEQFARGIWRSMIPSESPDWVLRVAELESTDQPLGDYGALVRRMLSAGLTANEIARFARIIGYEVAFGLTYYLGDPLAAASDDDPMEDVCWDFYRVDPDTDEPLTPLSWAHEVLLGLDPTGREMRPPPR
ncbi:MAG: hypothetical protein ACRBI6_02295 [Acidimicrobiales bacterium]